MKKRIADMWVKELRSGDWQRTTGQLETISEDGSKSFCCLGVLASMAVAEGVCEYDNSSEIGFFGADNAALTGQEVRKWSGLKSATGVLPGNTCLTELNDGGKSFTEIADIIEKNWRKL